MESEYKLYAKSSPDGRSLGDCPFTHRTNLALKLKGVNVTLVLINLANKPEWFKQFNPAGSVPVLEFGNEIIADSYQAVRHLETAHPSPPLDLPGNKAAEEATAQTFSIFSAWAKNADPDKDAELKAAFTAELERLNDYLGKTPGKLLCGDEWSIADCVLVPRLYHIAAVAEHYKSYTYYNELPHLRGYMDTAFSSEVFKATDYPKEYILQGWAKYFT